MHLQNVSNVSSFLELFNFSLDKAALELEYHISQDWMFEKSTEQTIMYFYIFLIISGVISNLIVTTIIVKNITLCSRRYPYVINLNVSDLILCLFCMPFTMLAVLRRNWHLGSILCKLVPFVQGSTVYVSSATVSVIAVDRHKNILSTFPRAKKKNQSCIVKTIFAIWISSFILSSPVSIATTVETVGLPGILIYEKCIEQWPWEYAKGIYTVITLIVQFLIPTTVLLVTHIRIETHLNFTINRQSADVLRLHKNRAKKELKRNRNATMVLLLISVVFGLTWMPWNILSLIADFYPKHMSTQDLYLAFTICHMIAMTSATSNPILYGWLNLNIRRELIKTGEKMFTLFFRRRNDTEYVLANCEKIYQKSTSLKLENDNNMEQRY